MQSRKSVKAALVKEIDAVRLRISLLESELCRDGRPRQIGWRSGYELNAHKARLVRLETVLAHYPSAPTARASKQQQLELRARQPSSFGETPWLTDPQSELR